MENEPYIGVTGFTSRDEVEQIVSAFEGKDLNLMLGVLFSFEEKYKYNDNCFQSIHDFKTYRWSTLADSIKPSISFLISG